MVFCLKCGVENVERARFCLECGTPIPRHVFNNPPQQTITTQGSLFSSWISAFRNGVLTEHAGIQDAFQAISQGGLIRPSEMNFYLERYLGHDALGFGDMEAIFNFIDSNGDGCIDSQEFLSFMCDLPRVPISSPALVNRRTEESGYSRSETPSPILDRTTYSTKPVSLPLVNPSTTNWTTGSKVEIQRSDGRWVPASIAQIAPDGQVTVKFLDEKSHELEKRMDSATAKKKIRPVGGNQQTYNPSPSRMEPLSKSLETSPMKSFNRPQSSNSQRAIPINSSGSPYQTFPGFSRPSTSLSNESPSLIRSMPVFTPLMNPEATNHLWKWVHEFKGKLEQRYTSMREAFLALDVDRDGY